MTTPPGAIPQALRVHCPTCGRFGVLYSADPPVNPFVTHHVKDPDGGHNTTCWVSPAFAESCRTPKEKESTP